MNTRKPVVLVAPLDWGLGHTVRCIPIIKELLKLGCEIVVACNSEQQQVLKEDFPSITYHQLEGYNIIYGRSKTRTLLSLFLQVPKLLIRANREKSWLKEFLRRNRVDAVISDNRYGFNASKIPSIFITHQLRIISGLGNWVDGVIQIVLYRYINQFDACWVPDWKNADQNLAGQLSHPTKLPRISIEYIGGLSRFEKCVEHSDPMGLLIILSGPEPQRTILELIILSQLQDYAGPAVFVRGVYNQPKISSFNHVTIMNNASSPVLNRLICNSKIVVCRAGYTSIMDILKLNKKSILIPTPGQGEQEYLADYLHRQKLAFTTRQEDFDLGSMLENTSNAHLKNPPQDTEEYKNVIREFIRSSQQGMVNQN